MRKAREQLMKMAIDQDIADPNTGEVIQPAVKKNSEFLKKIR
jgi:hypothetical protein